MDGLSEQAEQRRNGSAASEPQLLERRYLALGERLIALETEMSTRLQTHAEESAAASDRLEEARALLAERDAELARLRTELDAANAAIARLERDGARLRAEAERRETEVRELVSSTSWRTTQPLRSAVDRIRARR
jgi:chromosome segregation ATPase